MKEPLLSIFLVILRAGQVQSQDSHLPSMKAKPEEGAGRVIDWNGESGTAPGSPLSCVSNGDDYRLFGDGRIVHNGQTPGANDAMLTFPAGNWHSGAKLLGLFALNSGKEEAVLVGTPRQQMAGIIIFRSSRAKRAEGPNCSMNLH